MSHPGAHPLDPTSTVGALRVLVGDTATTPLDPPVAGQASYTVWSDADLTAALTIAGGSAYRAAGDLYTGIAAIYAQRGKAIRTDDLQLSTVGRSGDLLKIAQTFYAQADAADGREMLEFFDLAGGGEIDCDPYKVDGLLHGF